MSQKNTKDQQNSDDNNQPRIVRPDDDITDSTVGDSPSEHLSKRLSDRLKRDFIVASDDHPLVQTAGSKEALQSKTPVEVQKILADDLYQDPGVFFREWKQNHIAACVREGKRVLKEKKGRDALYYKIDHSHPELDETVQVQLPKSGPDILAEARELGYIPVIEFEVNYDEGKLITRDNGISMTSAEVISKWNEPAESGSESDLSSAGNKGIGSLTWVTIAGEEGAMLANVRTRRTETMSGTPVPERDRQGFRFLSYFGGVLPIDTDEEITYGTEFEMTVRDGLNPRHFKGHMENYTEVLPVQVTWYETENGVTEDDEFEKVDFLDRYDQEPAIVIDRPGEFTLVLDTPDIVPRGYSVNDTFLLDNPIEDKHGSFDTLWNHHLQLHNEKGLIIEGPNRGRRREQVDELYGEVDDILDDSKPMPDIPMPEPVASRDSLKTDEAHERFFTYVEHLAQERELSVVADYLNAIFDSDSTEEALEVVKERGSEYELYRKLLNKHAPRSTLGNEVRLYNWLIDQSNIDFDDDAPVRDKTNSEGEVIKEDHKFYSEHPKWNLIQLLTRMEDEVDVYTPKSYGDPNKKGNRSSIRLGNLLGTKGYTNIYVGATLHKDRVQVIFDNHDGDAAAIKVTSYGEWTGEPFNAKLVKEVPYTRDDLEDSDLYDSWEISDAIHDRNTRKVEEKQGNKTVTKDAPLKFRTTSNSAVDKRTTAGDVVEVLERTNFGETLAAEWTETTTDDNGDEVEEKKRLNLKHPWIVLFTTSKYDKFSISDYYHLSNVAAISKAKVEDAEVLMQYPQVFDPETFTRMLMDSKFDAYNPFTGEYETVTTPQIAGRRDQTHNIFLNTDKEHALAALLTGTQYSELPDSETGHELARDRVITRIASYYGLKNPVQPDHNSDDDEWRVVCWPDGNSLDQKKARAFWSVFLGKPKPTTLWKNHALRTEYGNSPNGMGTWYMREFDKIIRRSRYHGWEWDSNAWARYDESYSGPNEYEKAMYRVVRDLGIDPWNHTEQQFESVLRNLIRGCYGQDDGGDD